MKNTMRFFAVVMCMSLLLAFSACGDESAPVEDSALSGQSDDSGETEIKYLPPAEAVADPSSDAIRFTYDDEGRIVNCYYQVDGADIAVTYSYKDNTIQIYAFSGDIVVADETFTVSSYSADADIIAKDGYYFKGCVF